MKGETRVSLVRPGPITWIIVALLLWGCYLAIGSYSYGRTLQYQRGLIVFGTSVLFVSFWLVMLAVRKRRVER